MAIEKKLICFARLAEFERQLAAGNILEYSIVLIQDAKKIYNRGTYYDCNNVIPDWNAGEGEEGYIKNRTHFRIKDEFIATLDAGDGGTVVLNGTLPFLIENTSLLEGQLEIREVIVSKLDTEFEIPSIGPSIKAKITHDGINYIYEQLTTYGVSNILNFYHSRVTPLQDWAIPDTIVRNTDLATINGRSLTEGGDIAIDQPYITDFTVNDLLTLAEEEEGAIQARIDMLYDALSAHKVILVPYDANEGFQGYAVANGYMEDLLYLTVFHADGWVYLDLARDRNEILSSMVTLLNWSNKQDKLVSGTNIKTINGESILGEGDLTVEGGAKVYNWILPLDDNGDIINQGNVTQEEFDAIGNADILIVDGIVATKIGQATDETILIWATIVGDYAIGSYSIIIEKQSLAYQVFPQEMIIPTATSQLTNDSNFLDKDTADGSYVAFTKYGELDAVASIQAFDDGSLVYALPTSATGDEDDVIATRKTLKTINNQSLLGEGNIEIGEGESFWYKEDDGNLTTDEPVSLKDAYIESLSTPENGNGNSTYGVSGQVLTTNGEQCYWADAPSEDIRYFTEFTFDEFINACKNGSDISSNGLYDAIINNKLICIPYGDAGYIVSNSYYTDNQSWSERHSFTLEVEKGQIAYIAGIDTDDLTMDSLEGSTFTRVVQVEQLTSPKEDGSYLDNKTYIISNTVNELVVNFREGYLGTTICFTTGDDPVLEIVGDVLWANGAAPEIEANTAYELSLRADDNNNVLAVLVPFKSV